MGLRLLARGGQDLNKHSLEELEQALDEFEPENQPRKIDRRQFCQGLFWGGVAIAGMKFLFSDSVNASAEEIKKPFIETFGSPHNKTSSARKATEYIVLHTTQNFYNNGNRNFLSERGKAHYLVWTNGNIYRLVDKNLWANHCGISMWNGRRRISDISVAVETVGEYNKLPTNEQCESLKWLVPELKAIYNLGDKEVITHSMVAYSPPDKWGKISRRGRKKCGMLFNTKNIREKIGLNERVEVDPDVAAGRLGVGDKNGKALAAILYN